MTIQDEDNDIRALKRQYRGRVNIPNDNTLQERPVLRRQMIAIARPVK